MVKPAEHDSDTERRILDAAHNVFVRRGTAGARMQDIADEAGVNKALLHYYFRSKEKLAESVFRQAAQKLLPPLVAIMASDAELEEKVVRVVHHELDRLRETPYLPAYILSELNHHPERAAQLITSVTGLDPRGVSSLVLGRLTAQIEERVRSGRMRPIAPDQFLINLISLCIFPFAAKPMLGIMLGMNDEAFDFFIDRRKTELPDFFLSALRP